MGGGKDPQDRRGLILSCAGPVLIMSWQEPGPLPWPSLQRSWPPLDHCPGRKHRPSRLDPQSGARHGHRSRAPHGSLHRDARPGPPLGPFAWRGIEVPESTFACLRARDSRPPSGRAEAPASNQAEMAASSPFTRFSTSKRSASFGLPRMSPSRPLMFTSSLL